VGKEGRGREVRGGEGREGRGGKTNLPLRNPGSAFGYLLSEWCLV